MNAGIEPYAFDIFAAATAIGVFLQAGILLALLIAFQKLASKLEEATQQVSTRALPLIESSKVTLEDLRPKLKAISANLVEVSENLRHESLTIQASVDDVLAKTRAQTARVDEMVSGTLDGIAAAGAHLQSGVSVPLRHVNGIFNGIRAGLDVLRNKTPHVEPPITKADEPEVVVVVEEVISGRPIT